MDKRWTLSIMIGISIFANSILGDTITVIKTGETFENVKVSEGEVEDKKGKRTKVQVVDFEDGTQKAFVPESVTVEKKETNWKKDEEAKTEKKEADDPEADKYSAYIFGAWALVWLALW